MELNGKKIKLAVLASHPIEYQAPLFRRLARDPAVDLTVYFCWDFGVEETYDEGFKRMVQQSTSLLEGYSYRFLKNYSPKPSEHFWGQINSGIIRELRRNKYDAILIHGYVFFTNWLAFLGAWVMRTPIILRGETDLQKQVSPRKRTIKKLLLPILFSHIDAFLYSYSGNKEYYRFYGVPERKLFFLPCAVDNDFFKEAAEKLRGREAEMKRAIGLTRPELPVVLFVGQFSPRKRLMDLLRASEIAVPRAEFNLILVGDGEEAARIQVFIREKRLPNVYCVSFKNQSEIPMFYSIADIFVLPSEFDPSPKVINEAMNFGLAIIATDKVGTAPDLVVKSGSGYTYPVGDITALAAILEKVIRDEPLRRRLQTNARAIVEKWSYDEDVKGVLSALRYLNQKRYEEN